MGQGTPLTAVRMIMAERLPGRRSLDQVSVVQIDTNVSLSQISVASSLDADGDGCHKYARRRRGGPDAARGHMASTQLGVPAASLSVSNGVVSGGGKSVGYGALMAGKLFSSTLAAVTPTLTSPSNYRLIGTRVPRIDIPAIVTGQTTYIQNVRVPGMLHGRVVRPRGQGGPDPGRNPAEPRPELDCAHPERAGRSEGQLRRRRRTARVGRGPGRRAAQGQLGQHADAARRRRPLLSASRSGEPPERDARGEQRRCGRGSRSRGEDGHGELLHRVPTSRCARPELLYRRRERERRGRPLRLAGPSTSWTRASVSAALGVPPTAVRVQVFPASGHYGHNTYDDASNSAAILSQAVGKPVRVQFMRWDEHGWDQFGPAQATDVRAGIDANGKLVAYDYTAYNHGWTQVIESAAQLSPAPRLPPAPGGQI